MDKNSKTWLHPGSTAVLPQCSPEKLHPHCCIRVAIEANGRQAGDESSRQAQSLIRRSKPSVIPDNGKGKHQEAAAAAVRRPRDQRGVQGEISGEDEMRSRSILQPFLPGASGCLFINVLEHSLFYYQTNQETHNYLFHLFDYLDTVTTVRTNRVYFSLWFIRIVLNLLLAFLFSR